MDPNSYRTALMLAGYVSCNKYNIILNTFNTQKYKF